MKNQPSEGRLDVLSCGLTLSPETAAQAKQAEHIFASKRLLGDLHADGGDHVLPKRTPLRLSPLPGRDTGLPCSPRVTPFTTAWAEPWRTS